MEVNKKLSLNIGKNTAVKIDTPANYIGDIEYSVTPWTQPISKDKFSYTKENDGDKTTNKDIVSNEIDRIFGATRRVKLMVSVEIYLCINV